MFCQGSSRYGQAISRFNFSEYPKNEELHFFSIHSKFLEITYLIVKLFVFAGVFVFVKVVFLLLMGVSK